jgi:sialic acid synthase SpsE
MSVKKVEICGKTIPGDGVLIVAEIGSCHDGKLNQAKEMIWRSAEAGADVVKFQFFRAEHLYFKRDSRFEPAKKSETPLNWFPILSDVANKAGVHLTASAFDPEVLGMLVEGNVPFLKIASPEIRDPVLIGTAAESGLPLVLSTGVSSTSDVARAVEWAESCGATEIVLLQCASVYPASVEDVNLRVIETLRSAFGWPVGLSDHTLSNIPPIVAVAKGASMIEKHVTLDRSSEGADHDVALTFSEFEQMIDCVRKTEKALGSNRKKVLETENINNHKIKIFTKRKIKKGEKISLDKLESRRNNPKIDPYVQAMIVGSCAKRDIEKGEELISEVLE